jgi:Kelch motif protein
MSIRFRGPLVLLLVALAAPARAGTWSSAGSMSVPRSLHSATLLPNGKVLVAGGLHHGSSSLSIAASTELYDPASNSWSAGPDMSRTRSRHSGTLLQDGTVLIAGGRGLVLSQTSAELYDPVANAFTLTGPMLERRDNHTATLLADGRVLIAGGVSARAQGPFVLNSVEIYDPATGSFHAAAHMRNPRHGHAAVRLPDGRVLVAGGATSGGDCAFDPTAEIYDPATDAWTVTDTTPPGRGWSAAALLPGGKVLVAAGWAPPSCSASSEAALYDPASGAWSATGSLATARGDVDGAFAVLGDGSMLLAGGLRENFQPPIAAAEVYDPGAGAWHATGSLLVARFEQTTTRLADGRVLVTGGEADGNAEIELASAEIYTP